MRTSVLFCAMLLAGLAHGASAPVKDADTESVQKKAEERQRRYASIQKELEAARPGENATKEEIIAYLETAIEDYGKFARENPKTSEGFEAAFTLANLLTTTQYPDAIKYAQLAIDTAPAAGVDMRRVAFSYVLVAQCQLRKGDVDSAKATVEKIKPVDAKIYEQYSKELDQMVKQVAEAKETQRKAQDQLQPGKEPFPIEETDVNGQKFSLAKLKGKVVVIDFWAPWCGPCMAEMPNVRKLYKEYHAQGLEIVGISLDKDPEQLKTTMQENGIEWTTLSDHQFWNNAIARQWGVSSIPATFVLDRKGVIRLVNARGEELAGAVKKLLAEPAK